MSDSIMTIVAIFLAAVLMFVFPLLSISERNDDISQLSVQTATIEFVNKIRNSGKIKQEDYDAYIQTLAATGNSYDIELKVSILDENPGKKASQVDREKIGENVYYNEYTTQIEETMTKNNGTYYLKQGDMISTSVKNTNTTISQMLKNFFYSISGNGTYQVSAQHSGIVTASGK